MRAAQRIGVVIALALCSSSTGVARANGRFPQAQTVETVPGSDGTKLTLRATFGLLVSNDAGRSWRWICERALGYEGQWDPPIVRTRDGTLHVGLARGVVATRDDGCTVTSSPEIAAETIKDLTTDGRGETVWAIAGKPGKKSSVWRKPLGKPWERMPAEGLADLNLLSIEVAPGRPDRIYVSGEPYETIRGRLYRSDDGGKTFEGAANDEKPDGPFFIAAVDPKEADRVLVRHLHAQGSELLLTKDAGKSFTNVLSMKSAMFGFAKASDGKTYWAGSGLAEGGLFQSTDRGEHFVRVASHGVLCLAAAGEHLYACENAMSVGAPILAGATDGKTLVSLSGFADVVGPVACAGSKADAGASLCAATWPEVEALIRPPAASPSGAASSSAAREADAAREARDAGSSGASAAPARRASKGACGCRAAGAGAVDPALFIAGSIALAAWSRHRRRRGSARSHVARR